MASSMLYTRRLMKSELDTWLHIGREPLIGEVYYAKEFLSLPDSMFFIATIDGNPVGGTAIYRDRTRLGMALVAARLEADFRENTSLQLFKASLPFFKTLSIRDVDAIVGSSNIATEIPFPLNQTLQNWTRPALERMGFQEVTKTYGITIEGRAPENLSSRLGMDKIPNYDGARELLWNQRKNIGLSCSQQWLAFDIAKARNTMRTFSIDNKTCLVVATESFDNANLIPFFVANSEFITSAMVAETILQHFAAKKLIFTLLGKEQKEPIDIMQSHYNSDRSMNEYLLLRKQL